MVHFEEKPDLWLRFDSIRVGKPCYVFNRQPNEAKIKTPQQCRTSQDTYSAPIYVDVSYASNTSRLAAKTSKNLCIGYMPIMLHSNPCHLNNKSEKELAEYGECIYDYGGYFIVMGQEKVMLIQEQLAKNRIIINFDEKLASLTAHVTSSTDLVKSRTSVYFKHSEILVKHNALKTPINITILFRVKYFSPFSDIINLLTNCFIFIQAMGIESDQEIVQMVGSDLMDDLGPSLQRAIHATVDTLGDGMKHPVYTQTLVCFDSVFTLFFRSGLDGDFLILFRPRYTLRTGLFTQVGRITMQRMEIRRSRKKG